MILIRFVCLVIGFIGLVFGQRGPIEPNAGRWKTFVISSGQQFRLSPPPDAATTRAEIGWLRRFMAENQAASVDQIKFWDAGSPTYRWIEFINKRLLRGQAVGTPGFRAYALLAVAMYDATIAAWDSKYVYNRPRPAEFDATLVPMLDTPRSPSYPAEHAVTAGAAAAVLSYLLPAEAASLTALAEEAARSRLAAGLNYPSDVTAGLQLGRIVGERVVERARADGSAIPWTGSVPTGQGFWVGTNPANAAVANWQPWLLSSPSEFRPGPIAAYNSPQILAELAEIKTFPRTFDTNARALFWQTNEGIFTFWFDYASQRMFEEGIDENPPLAARAYALLAVAQQDAVIATQDAKYTYWFARPSQLDPSVALLFPNPNHPSYPSNHALWSVARSEVLAYLFPRSADEIRALGEEAGWSRLWAGIHYRSDIEVGFDVGRKVARKVLEWAETSLSR